MGEYRREDRIDEGIEFLTETRWVMLEILKQLEKDEEYEKCQELFEHATDVTKEIEELKRLKYIRDAYGRQVDIR